MPSAPSRKGVSRSVRMSSVNAPISRPTSGHSNLRSLGSTAIQRERYLSTERFRMNTRGLGQSSLQALSELRGDVDGVDPSGVDNDEILGSSTGPDNGDGILQTLEADGTAEDPLAHTARDILGTRWATRHHYDARTWRQRIQRLHQNWAPLVEILADAYMEWKYGIRTDTPMSTNTNAPPATPATLNDTEPPTETYNFTIHVVDIYSLAQTAEITRSATSKSTAEALVLQGFLGASPENPSIVLSLRTLELYESIRKRKALFSIDAFAKVLCDAYQIPFRRRYRNALSDSFDVYLEIHQVIEKRVAGALGRTSENWRVLNACPPCNYQLEDEPPLKFKRLFAGDGNNSLKRVGPMGGRSVADSRIFEGSDYYLSKDFVEQYANEVKSHTQAVDSADAANHESADQQSTAGDPTDGITSNETSPTAPCADNWKAAASAERKRMWAIFEETGIFASACRHGFILWLADMVRCGELAKFPLAVVAKALEVFGGNWMMGYDIGCSFGVTLANSSLGQLFEERGCRCCVNAFHGYSHSFSCQVKHHPNIIEGMGLEDLETLERIFSASNQLGGVTRHMSAYRRRVYIDLFFRQWDAEKYENLATMLYNNYVQALKIIEHEEPALNDAKASLGIQPGDLERWKAQEVQYFLTLGEEPEAHTLKIAYVELLQDLREMREREKKVSTEFMTVTPADAAGETYASQLSQTRKLETERRYTAERHAQILHQVIELEVKLGIDSRWPFTSSEYQETLKYMASRKYHQALDKLQKLVILRLFELHKLNLNQTAYRMRTHIAKSLQTRCKAIRNALNAYNAAAQAMSPPRPSLDWSRVSHFTFLEEFNLLRDTRQDIMKERWADLAVRETMKQDQKLKRAREEIIRCNVETRRLHTAILDENLHFNQVLAQLAETGTPLHGAVDAYTSYRRRVNDRLLIKISQIYALNGFTGTPLPGIRKGALTGPIMSPLPANPEHDGDGIEDVENDDDEYANEVNGLVDYISEMSISKP